jgi:hypothetical protein
MCQSAVIHRDELQTVAEIQQKPTVDQLGKIKLAYFFTVLPTIHLISKIAPAIAATLKSETATVVIIRGAT